MLGVGYGIVADYRVPRSLVAAHCSQLRTDASLAWLEASERALAERLCYESGTVCSAGALDPTPDPTPDATPDPALDAGEGARHGACSEPTDLMRSLGTLWEP